MLNNQDLWDRLLTWLARRRAESESAAEPGARLSRAGTRIAGLVLGVLLAAVMSFVGIDLGLSSRRPSLLRLLWPRRPRPVVHQPLLAVELKAGPAPLLRWADTVVLIYPTISVSDTGPWPPNRVAFLILADTSPGSVAAQVGPGLLAGLPDFTGFASDGEPIRWEADDTLAVPARTALKQETYLHLCVTCDKAAAAEHFYFEQVYRLDLNHSGLDARPERVVGFQGRYAGTQVRLRRP